MIFEINTNAAHLAEAFRNSPESLRRHLSPALNLSAQIIARQGKRNIRANDSLAYHHLLKSVKSRMVAGGLEAEVFAGTNYAFYVEKGTHGGGYPNQQTIIDWLRKRHIRPNNPNTSESELAYLIARKIVFHGTPAKPFLEPAFESEKAATINRVNAAVQQALREIH